MITIHGKGVCGAIGIGTIRFIKREEIGVTRAHAANKNEELYRFRKARQKAIASLSALYDKACREIGEANAQIFEIHQMMLTDDDFTESVENIILHQNMKAEYAVAVTADNFSALFSAMDDEYMKARAVDVKDASNRLLEAFSSKSSEPQEIASDLIICADDLAPSETVQLDKSRVLGFITRHGSKNSHTAILARTMNLPAVIGTGDALREEFDGKTAAVDGFSGTIYIDPNPETLQMLRQKQKEDLEHRRLLETLKGKENITRGGRKIHLFANIGGLSDLGEALMNDCGGIGLFRSEFLYLEKTDYPTEAEQLAVYRQVLESMAGKKVIIRTLDIGADKQIDYFGLEKEENPALGYRAIRICLTRPELFKTQLRALFRASVYGNLAIMYPMISSVSEVLKIRNLVDEVQRELTMEGIPFSSAIEHGIMVETPAAAILSDRLAPLVDFFSIGTNDLTQYTLAADRQNPLVDEFSDPHSEAIMRLISYTASSAKKFGKWVGICGELGGDTSLTEHFLDMGIDELSVSPSRILYVREKIRSIER